MILRKPYAVFIKYFKLLHLIMALLVSPILYKSIRVFNFFKNYSIDYKNAMKNFIVENFLNVYIFIFIVIILVLTIILLSVMFYKDKPKSLYVYNLFLYIFVFVLFFLINSSLNDISTNILSIRVSKAFRDFVLIAVILEFLDLVWLFVRATGFDIKRFNFSDDLEELDISEKDSEEIEVAINFDKNEIRRNYNYKLRHLKYFYFEHKFILNISFVLAIFLVYIFVYFTVGIYTVKYSQGKEFNVNGVTLKIKDSYVIDSDSAGDESLVIVRFQAKSKLNKKTLNTGLFNLRIDDFSYGQNAGYAVELFEFGVPYVNQLLTSNYQTYFIVFEIPSLLSNDSMNVKINDSSSFIRGAVGLKNILVRLKPIDLRGSGQSYHKSLNETISFEDSILGESNLTIDNYEISNSFKESYEYCYSINKCINSFEYVIPTSTGNYYKTLLKLSGNLVLDESVNASEIYDIRTLLNTFGTINYNIDGSWKSKKISSSLIKFSRAINSSYYIEIPYEVKDALEINLTLDIYNQSYKYILK